MSTQAPSIPPPKAPKEKTSEKERKSKYKFKADGLSKAKKAAAGIPTEPSRNVPGKALVDFFIFAKFPAEIQDEVWEIVCFQNPATISVIVEKSVVRMVGPLPNFPSLLHATSGARGIGLRYYEVLTSFDEFDREAPLHPGPIQAGLQAGAPNPAPAQAGPGLGNVHGPAPAPVIPNAQQAPIPWLTAAPPGAWAAAAAATVNGNGPGVQGGLYGQMNQAAQMFQNNQFALYGPGHVLGTAGNNPNNGTFTTMNYVLPVPPLGHHGGNGGHGGAVAGGGVNGTHGGVAGGVNGAGGAPTREKDKNKVILLGAFPVLAGNVVGLCDEPDPTHPLLPVQGARKVLPDKPGCRNFYVNLTSDMFKLQIGDVFQYNYPTFSLAEESSVTCVKKFILTNSQRQEQVSTLLENYAVHPGFPAPGKIPSIFMKVENLVLNISLPPCVDPHEYSTWAAKNARALLSSLYVRTTIRRFPNIRTLDFYIPGDHKINPFGKMGLKHWREVVVRDSDGMTLSRSQMALLEMIMEDEMVSVRKEVGNNDIPTSRLLVYVPQKADRMEWDADIVD